MNAKLNSLILLVMMLLLLGCQSASNGEEGSSESVGADSPVAESENEPTAAVEPEVTLVFAVNGWERGRFDTVVQQFEEEFPTIAVEVISVEEIVGSQGIYGQDGDPTQGMLKLMQGADVVNTYLDQSLYRPGLFLNIGPLLDSDPIMNRDDFYAGVLDLYTTDGDVWAVPFRAGFGLFFYNKDLFDAAGVPYPEAGWTWDDMVAKAQALTQRTGDQTDVWGVAPANFGHAMMVMSQGVSPVVNNGPIAEPNFTTPDVEAAVQAYVDLFLNEQVAPFEYYDEISGQMMIGGQPNNMGVYGMIDSGQVAMWAEYSDAWQYRSEAGLFELGVAPFPVNETTQNTTPLLPYGSVFAISAGTQKREAAWQFVSYLTGQIEQMSTEYEQNSVPARRSASANYWANLDPELKDALEFAADHAFYTNNYSPVMGNFEMAIQNILLNNTPVSDALADAQVDAERTAAEMLEQLNDQSTEEIGEFVVQDPEVAAEGTTTITFVVAGGDPNLFRETAKRFQTDHPDIVVRILEPNYFNMQEFDMSAAIQGADCFQWWGTLTAPEDLALVLSPQPFLDADPEMGQDAFFPAALNQMTVQGQLIGIPHEISMTLMNFNRDLFDAAGRPYPEPGWTMDDFLETAVAMTTEGDESEKVWGFVGNPYEFGDLLIFAERLGADFFDTESAPPHATFNTPEVIAAMNWFSELTTEYGVKPVFDLNTNQQEYIEADDPWFQRQALIENERAAIWTGDMFGYVEYSPEGEPLETDTSWIGYVPYPVGSTGGVGFDSVSGMYISASTDKRQACWEWIKYAVQDSTLIFYGLPSHQATADTPELVDRYTPERIEVMKGSVLNSVRGSDQNIYNSQNGWVSLSFFWLERAYHEANIGDKSMAQAIQEAQGMADEFEACMIAADDFTNYETSDRCARETDPNWGQPIY